MTRYLTINDAASALSVSVNTVRSMLPKLNAVDLRGGGGKNRLIRIPVEAIERFLRDCEIIPPATKKSKPTEWHIERRKS